MSPRRSRAMSKGGFVFLLGIPGCGKSEVYNRLAERFRRDGVADSVDRLDDYPILWEYFQEDGPKTKPTEDGGYKILDPTLWDDVLVSLDEQCREAAEEGQVLFIEFARGENRPALDNFSDDVLDRSVIVYIYCPFDEAWRRNLARYEEQGTDDHMVSREEMEETYGDDDHEALLADPPVPAVRIDNDEPRIQKLDDELDDEYDELVSLLRRRMN